MFDVQVGTGREKETGQAMCGRENERGLASLGLRQAAEDIDGDLFRGKVTERPKGGSEKGCRLGWQWSTSDALLAPLRPRVAPTSVA